MNAHILEDRHFFPAKTYEGKTKNMTYIFRKIKTPFRRYFHFGKDHRNCTYAYWLRRPVTLLIKLGPYTSIILRNSQMSKRKVGKRIDIFKNCCVIICKN